jgi:hypothetical protein
MVVHRYLARSAWPNQILRYAAYHDRDTNCIALCIASRRMQDY